MSQETIQRWLSARRRADCPSYGGLLQRIRATLWYSYDDGGKPRLSVHDGYIGC
jgi:hypothetical protein